MAAPTTNSFIMTWAFLLLSVGFVGLWTCPFTNNIQVQDGRGSKGTVTGERCCGEVAVPFGQIPYSDQYPTWTELTVWPMLRVYSDYGLSMYIYILPKLLRETDHGIKKLFLNFTSSFLYEFVNVNLYKTSFDNPEKDYMICDATFSCFAFGACFSMGNVFSLSSEMFPLSFLHTILKLIIISV